MRTTSGRRLLKDTPYTSKNTGTTLSIRIRPEITLKTLPVYDERLVTRPKRNTQISSRPVSPTTTLVPETRFSQENALLRSAYSQCTVMEHRIISAPTQVLPSLYLKPPATPNTQCFRCHNKGHYQENCPAYWCPHCHEMAPGHPSHLCLRTRCTFCKHWGHSDRACPNRICGDCDQPGHVADDCPFSNLTPEQVAHVFGDRTPL